VITTITIRHGDVWLGPVEANIVGYDPRLDQFSLSNGGRIARRPLLAQYVRQHRGTGKVLWEGSRVPGAL
jgi:hypothetical protein